MSTINDAELCNVGQRVPMKVIFCFESASTIRNAKEVGSALGLPKVRDLQRYDERFHRCLDAVLHWGELGHRAELWRYYIAELRDDDHVRQATTVLRLMDVGFTGAYLYQNSLSSYLWEPLLGLASDLERVTSHRSTGDLSQLRLKLGLKQSVSDPLSRRLLKARSASDACTAKTLKAALNVLRASVDGIKLGE